MDYQGNHTYVYVEQSHPEIVLTSLISPASFLKMLISQRRVLRSVLQLNLNLNSPDSWLHHRTSTINPILYSINPTHSFSNKTCKTNTNITTQPNTNTNTITKPNTNTNITTQPNTNTNTITKTLYHHLLLVFNPSHPPSNLAANNLIAFLPQHYPNILLSQHHPPQLQHSSPTNLNLNLVDLVIAIGGDGTILHVSQLFSNRPCPPILGFNLGTIGFLLPFPPRDFENVLSDVLHAKVASEQRMRLDCLLSISHTSPASPVRLSAMNEIALHRSQSPHMASLSISIDGHSFTQTVADGLIVATPTGSTAYSCSAGGPIVGPDLDALLITPICPRSLSFRPLVLPANLDLKLTLDSTSRSSVDLSIDGTSIQAIKPGQSISILRSEYPVTLFSPIIGIGTGTYQKRWIDNVNELLNFNRPYSGRG